MISHETNFWCFLRVTILHRFYCTVFLKLQTRGEVSLMAYQAGFFLCATHLPISGYYHVVESWVKVQNFLNPELSKLQS